MELFICFFIMFAKILETGLATFRIIILNNNNKVLASLLSSIIAIIWILSASLVIIDIESSLIRIVFLTIGCFIGSYIGSYIEEKIAFGYIMSLVITSNEYGKIIANNLIKNDIIVTYTKALENQKLKNILIIFCQRKKITTVKQIINKIDKHAVISTESVKFI